MIRSKHFIFTVLLVSFSLLVNAQKINGVSFVASRDSITSLHVNSVIDVNANYVALMPFGFIKSCLLQKFVLILKGNGLANENKVFVSTQKSFKTKELSL